jgi:sugar lactone lactonase YvrE
MNKLSFLLVLAFSVTTYAQDSAQFYFTKAREARDKNDSVKFYRLIKKAVTHHPYHAVMLYQSAVAAAKMRNEFESLDYLKRAVRLNTKADLDNPAFKSLRKLHPFKQIQELRDRLGSTIVTSDTAFTVPDRSLHIECIAAGKNETLYLGSIHKRKIISIDRKGTIRDFTSDEQDGLTSVFGIKIDDTKSVLWACSSPMREMENYDSTSQSAVYKYDLKTKTLLKKYAPNEEMLREFVFGDLLIDKNGDVYVSDSKNNIIFKVNEKRGILERFYTTKEFWNIQGITLSDDGQVMFISDYIKGLYMLHIKSKLLIKYAELPDYTLKSIDGLTFYKGSLIAIQNGIQPMRVMRYHLSKDLATIVKAEVIDRAHPAFNEPTIGCVSDGNFYYVANSLWSGYTKDAKLKPVGELEDVVVLKAKL